MYSETRDEYVSENIDFIADRNEMYVREINDLTGLRDFFEMAGDTESMIDVERELRELIEMQKVAFVSLTEMNREIKYLIAQRPHVGQKRARDPCD